MQFKNQWFGEALATPAYPLDSRGETIFEGLGGPRSWIEGSSFGADADTAAADLIGSPHEGATRESTTPPESGRSRQRTAGSIATLPVRHRTARYLPRLCANAGGAGYAHQPRLAV
jgi:hypothetical protein